MRFNAWREGILLYAPWYVGGFVSFFLGSSTFVSVLGCIFCLIGLAVMLFFRDPKREIPAGDNDLLCPADGRVVDITYLDQTPHYEGGCIRISVFLSVLDVHVNRAPFSGKVTRIVYTPGRFLDARLSETTEVNESLNLYLETSHGLITVRQIAGKIARRIVCRVAPGESLQRGEKYGMIRFGSRTELYVPRSVELCVQIEQRVFAGKTIVGRFV